MSSTSLRPILRSSNASLKPCSHRPSLSIVTSQPQRRTATMIRRPQRPQRFEQIVILSDGSSYKQLTTSPQGIVRSNKDVRNHVLWNPSSEKLANVEEDEAGRLRRFREKFGTGFDAARTLAQEAGDMAAVRKMDSHWEVGGKMHEAQVDEWKEKIASQPELPTEEPATPTPPPVEDNLFGLISGSYVAPQQTDYGRRAKRAKRNAKNPPSEGGGSGSGSGKK